MLSQRRWFSFPIIFLLLTSPLWANEIPVMGLDQQGNQVEFPSGKIPFKKKMKRAIRGIGEETLPVLMKRHRVENRSWKLDKVAVGLGVKASLGLGGLIKGSATPVYVLIYKKGGQQ